MSGTTIDVTMPDGVADSYLARPDDGEGHPGVLLIMDAFGLRPQIERMADRIAERGFVVLAPNVFYRAGRAPVVSIEGLEDPEKREAVFSRVMPMVGRTDAGADRRRRRRLPRPARRRGAPRSRWRSPATAWAAGSAGGSLPPIPTASPRSAAFTPAGLATDDDDSPHLSAGEIDAELYLGFADNDQSMTPEQIATVEQALDGCRRRLPRRGLRGCRCTATRWPTPPPYDEAAAERHFEQLFALLGRTVAT